MSRVFIGLPTYNGAAHLREALDSVLAQTHQDWILLISDNGSTDETADICQEYAARDSRIRVHVHPSNRGAWNNFKFLLEQAEGPCFLWFPDDYRMEERFLEVCTALLDGDVGIGMAMTNLAYVDARGRTVVLNSEASKIVAAGDRGRPLIFSYLLAKEMGVWFYAVYRTEIIRKAVAPFWDRSHVMVAFDCYVVLRALCMAGMAVDPGFRQIIRYEDHYDQRSLAYSFLGFGSGFGLRFLWESVRALPWRWKPAGFVILSVRFLIGTSFKFVYMMMIEGWRGLARKVVSVFRMFRNYVASTDERSRSQGDPKNKRNASQ